MKSYNNSETSVERVDRYVAVSIHFGRFQDAFAWSERRCLAAFARRAIANVIQRGVVFSVDH